VGARTTSRLANGAKSAVFAVRPSASPASSSPDEDGPRDSSVRHGLELGESGSQVVDDLAGDDVGGRQVVDVVQGVVLEPGDVEIGLVAGHEVLRRQAR